MLEDRITQHFPKDAELIKALVLKYGQNIHPEQFETFLTQLKTSQLFEEPVLTPKLQMLLMVLVIVEDTIALNSEYPLTVTSTADLQTIKAVLLTGKCRFGINVNLGYASAMLIVDPTQKQNRSPLMLLSGMQPNAADVVHELVHLAQVTREQTTETEYIEGYASREQEAYEFAAAYMAATDGFGALQYYKQIHDKTVNDGTTYLAQVISSRSAFMKELRDDPKNKSLRAKIFVNYMVEQLNLLAMQDLPQNVALKNYQLSFGKPFDQAQQNAAGQKLQQSIIQGYNHDFIAPVFKKLWDLFVNSAAEFQKKHRTPDEVKRAFSGDAAARQFQNDEERRLATLLIDLYVKALFDDDITQVLSEFEAKITTPLQTQIHMEVF